MEDNNKKPTRVIFRAPVLSQSGYGTHSRQVATWLLNLEAQGLIELKFDLVQWGITPWHVDTTAFDGLIEKCLMRIRQQNDTQFDVSFQLQLPNEWDPFLAKVNVGITAGVETDVCNPTWIDCCNRMDHIVVPSEFTKSVFEKTGNLTVPVTVIGESWFKECDGAKRSKTVDTTEIDKKLQLQTNFNFLTIAQFTGNNPENDRKNLAYTIKWLIEEFKGNEDVGLIVKTNFGRLTKMDEQNCLKTLSQIVLGCMTEKDKGPKIYLLHGHMSEKDIVSLYTHPKIKALVSLTRGEGFGLPLLEAASCGLPVVATGWSAHTEFLGLGKYMKVEYVLDKVHPSRIDGAIFVENSKWANPSESDFKRKIKRFYNSPSVPTSWATELQSKIQKEYSPSSIEKKYSEFLTGPISELVSNNE